MKIRELKFLFVLSFLLISAVIAQMSWYGFYVVTSHNLFLNIAKVCHNWLQAIDVSPLNALLQLLAISTIVLFLIQIGRQFRLHHRFHRRMEALRDEPLTTEVRETTGFGNKNLIVVQSDEWMALTCGFLKPKIILSSEMVAGLEKDELRAVVYHEGYHQRYFDPLKKLLIQTLTAAFWYIPILKWVAEQYHVCKELAADQYSIDQMDNDLYLSAALLKLVRNGQGKAAHSFAVSFADTAVNYRIQQLVKPDEQVKVAVPLGSALLSFIIFLGMTGMFIIALP
ncbi:M56 family metallopeptidase [Halobacillus sp. BAB-2008]|uniref:M56 family metallopeptidase n=1 Tax=Halobacillus sp. BAB-2008 TaxID=1246484 RepID=UPI0002A4F220|nr:M56 family metallopeptidase [Halobacillus sp. BAB-2008]ELK45996.1 M56 family unassigned peptidase [Halobacillus sp. BAB-2008]